MEKPNYQCKLITVGSMAVGKSSIVYRLIRNRFNEQMEMTVGAALITHDIQLKDCTIKLTIWDTAGQEKYAQLVPLYYREAQAVLLVYDITNQQSYKRAKEWLDQIQQCGNPSSIITLIGNKADLQEQQQITSEEVKEFCLRNKIMFGECSAKTGEGVNEIFVRIAEQLPKAHGNEKSGEVIKDGGRTNVESSKKCC